MRTVLVLVVCSPFLLSALIAAAAPEQLPKNRSALFAEIRAQLVPKQFTTLAAEIGAKIQSIPVPEGGPFNKGDLLIDFDCTLQNANLNKAKATMRAAKKVYSANQRLAELNSVGQVELLVSEAELDKSKAEVESFQALISKCQIIAPFSGRIAELEVREQQYVKIGSPLVEILDDSALELKFIVPSKWLAWLEVGAHFSIVIDETNINYDAKVSQIGAKVDPISQSIEISGIIVGDHPELITGMSGQVIMQPPDDFN